MVPGIVVAELVRGHQPVLPCRQVGSPAEQQVCPTQRGRHLNADALLGGTPRITADPVARCQRHGPFRREPPDEVPRLPAITQRAPQYLTRIKTAGHAGEPTGGCDSSTLTANTRALPPSSQHEMRLPYQGPWTDDCARWQKFHGRAAMNGTWHVDAVVVSI